MTEDPAAEDKPHARRSAARSEPGDMAKLAHELKTPLSAIAAAAEIMRDERLGPLGSERYRGYAGDIYDSARHALGVIDRLLAAARGDNTATELSFAQLDLNELTRGVVSTMRPLAAEAGLELDCVLAERLPHVVADRTSVRQMLLNLLTNAIKFTGRGGRVQVSTRYTLDGPVAIEVRDNGPGLDSEGGPKGLGIGLPLVEAMAGANGASMASESRPGEGTAVRITFRKDHVVPV